MLLQRFSCKDSVAQLLDPACCLEFDVWCFSCWTIAAMLRVISPLTAEEKATFSEDEVPSSVKALKQCLALQIGVPCFQLRILKDTNILDDAEPLRCEDVQLVLMKFQAPSHIKDRELLWAAAVHNPNHLEDNLNAPRDPNLICSHHGTALYVASQHNSLACAVLLVEAKADLELGTAVHAVLA